MASTPLPPDERERLRDLERHDLHQAGDDPHLQRIVSLARSLFHTPIALISLVERDRQWFLARQGLEVRETPREQAFCGHTILGDEVLVVPDALQDERFAANPLVTGEPHIRFYAGAPLRSRDGHGLGSLCVIDREPHQPSAEQIEQLQLLAELVMREIEWRRIRHHCPVTDLPQRSQLYRVGSKEFERAQRHGLPLSLLCIDLDNFRQINQNWGHPAGDQVLREVGQLCRSLMHEHDLVARFGDSEFALLLPEREGDAAMALAETLRQGVAHLPGPFSGSGYQLQVSGGLSSRAGADSSFSDLLHRAERALQLAKTNGRNQISRLIGPDAAPH
ncbi:MAG: GGDEF domain-containing protein [Synechococcus sp.]